MSLEGILSRGLMEGLDKENNVLSESGGKGERMDGQLEKWGTGQSEFGG